MNKLRNAKKAYTQQRAISVIQQILDNCTRLAI